MRFKPWTVCPIAQSLYKLCHPIRSHYKWYTAISKKCLLKWTTFHLKLYASSIFVKFIQFVQGVPTEHCPASSKQNTWMAAYDEFKTWKSVSLNIDCVQKVQSFYSQLLTEYKMPPSTHNLISGKKYILNTFNLVNDYKETAPPPLFIPSYSTMSAIYHRRTVPYGEKINSKQCKHARLLRLWLLSTQFCGIWHCVVW
jgi:hypothetical protein